jgi:hypothetical protein
LRVILAAELARNGAYRTKSGSAAVEFPSVERIHLQFMMGSPN